MYSGTNLEQACWSWRLEMYFLLFLGYVKSCHIQQELDHNYTDHYSTLKLTS